MKIISVVGARPNFMKIAPFIKAIKKHNQETSSDPKIEHTLVHTGQHYDDRMSRSFFEALNIPEADINMSIGSGSHAEQVGQTMIVFEKILMEAQPDWVVVVGDVNATLACSVTAKKLHIKVCHIEAGLRSRDMTMPEEINRLVTDRLSDLLLAPDQLSCENLRKEGVEEYKIKCVGNIMIDTLKVNLEKARKLSLDDIITRNIKKVVNTNPVNFNHSTPDYAVLTMHRPSNVDHQQILTDIVDFLINTVAHRMYLIWSLHPRTEKQLGIFGLMDQILSCENLILLDPVGYHDMLKLNLDAKIMFTDSGGLQEECCITGTPCLTLRWNTERPITLRENGGVSTLVGNDISKIAAEFERTVKLNKSPHIPPLWDGSTADRCLQAILDYRLV